MDKIDHEIYNLLLDYLKLKNPEKQNFNPKIIEIIGNLVVFELKHHNRLYCVSIKSLKLAV